MLYVIVERKKAIRVQKKERSIPCSFSNLKNTQLGGETEGDVGKWRKEAEILL